MMYAEDISRELGISKGYAYKIIKELNQELKESGFIVISGRVPRAFWETKFYGNRAQVETVQRKEDIEMPVYKDTERGSWYCQFYYEDWTGKRKKKYKRGFRTKKEAQDFESEFKRVASADMDMSVASFVDIYFKDKEVQLRNVNR